MIFDIQRFSVHDGPGIRVNIFLKGCRLRCRWCHNPEGLRPERQLLFHEEACIGCNQCTLICPYGVHAEEDGVRRIYFERCRACGKCVAECPPQALKLVGMLMSAAEVCAEAEKENAFFGTEGGITFSGGEPMLQPEFLREALGLLKEKRYHTAVETSGMAPWENFQQVIGFTDLFLYDYKLFDSKRHKEYTGKGNEMIRTNLRRLKQAGAEIRIRIPVIKDVNDRELELIAQDIEALGIKCVEVFPYHKIGISKYCQIGYEPPEPFKAPGREELEKYRELFREKGIQAL
nr:glycyl-radical enzyme activating protein [Christensenella intestinihominis]